MNILGTINLTGCSYQIGYDLLGRNIANNSSTVRLYGVLNVTGTYVSWTRGTASVGGSSKGISTYYSHGSYTLIQVDKVLKHDDKGNYSATISGSLNTTFVNGTVSGKLTLPKINRYPILSKGTDFNDEENPTINFTSYGTYPLRAKIEAGGNTQLIIRDLSNRNATSYTFELTEEERDSLRELCPNSNTLKVRETICAMNGNTEISSSYIDKTMTIVNGNPTFSNFDFEDVNPKTLSLTGNSKYNINGYSTILATIIPENKAIANKKSIMNKYRFIIGNDTKDIQYNSNAIVSGSIANSQIGTYNVYAIDSRNNSTLVTKLATNNIAYEPISIDKNTSSTIRNNNVGKNCILTYKGKVWNNSFGQVTNSIKSAKYKFKKTTSNEWIEGTSDITPIVSSNGEFSFNGPIRSNSADYTWDEDSSYNIQITISDELTSITYEMILSSAIPSISFANNGVGIMCIYDESIGGLLQVGGQKIV